eukprot:RCo042737
MLTLGARNWVTDTSAAAAVGCPPHRPSVSRRGLRPLGGIAPPLPACLPLSSSQQLILAALMKGGSRHNLSSTAATTATVSLPAGTRPRPIAGTSALTAPAAVLAPFRQPRPTPAVTSAAGAPAAARVRLPALGTAASSGNTAPGEGGGPVALGQQRRPLPAVPVGRQTQQSVGEELAWLQEDDSACPTVSEADLRLLSLLENEEMENRIALYESTTAELRLLHRLHREEASSLLSRRRGPVVPLMEQLLGVEEAMHRERILANYLQEVQRLSAWLETHPAQVVPAASPANSPPTAAVTSQLQIPPEPSGASLADSPSASPVAASEAPVGASTFPVPSSPANSPFSRPLLGPVPATSPSSRSETRSVAGSVASSFLLAALCSRRPSGVPWLPPPLPVGFSATFMSLADRSS